VVKVAARSVDGFLRAPPPEARAVLVYGPDEGLVRERSVALLKTVVEDLNDPFRVSEMTGEALASDPGRLGDEAAALSMMGGRRVVWVRGAADGVAGVFDSFLAAPVGDALVVVSGGDLAPRSKLRKGFEASPNGAALPCYADESAMVDRLIDEGLRPLGVRLDRDARGFLTEHLGSDRGVTRSEIDKLALYAGRDGHLDLDTVMTLVGDNAATSLEESVLAAVDGDASGLDLALERAGEADVAPVALLRSAGGFFGRVRRVQDMIAEGGSSQSAISALKPPVFYKTRPRLEAAVKRWAPGEVSEALRLILEAEAACKQSGMPAWLLCHRCLHQVAAMGRRAGRGGGRRPR
jgi:DNA polymerase-3 subunit delta